jgi:hypothetical protein
MQKYYFSSKRYYFFFNYTKDLFGLQNRPILFVKSLFLRIVILVEITNLLHIRITISLKKMKGITFPEEIDNLKKKKKRTQKCFF